jgi:ribosomal protein S27AE
VGGYGSGNRLYGRRRHSCNEYLPLDIRHLEKNGALVSGRTGHIDIQWGKKYLGLRFEAFPHVLRLYYRVAVTGGEMIETFDAIELDRTAQRLGGKRSWFKCPRCGDRCGILYHKERFACRKCHRLAYASQRQSPQQRAYSQARKIRRNLGSSGSLEEPFPKKPTGMHQSTYERLLERHDAYVERGNDAPFEAMMATVGCPSLVLDDTPGSGR